MPKFKKKLLDYWEVPIGDSHRLLAFGGEYYTSQFEHNALVVWELQKRTPDYGWVSSYAEPGYALCVDEEDTRLHIIKLFGRFLLFEGVIEVWPPGEDPTFQEVKDVLSSYVEEFYDDSVTEDLKQSVSLTEGILGNRWSEWDELDESDDWGGYRNYVPRRLVTRSETEVEPVCLVAAPRNGCQ